LASTSPVRLAEEILSACLAGAAPPAGALDTLADWALDADEALASSASRALFASLVEPLADRFEPALCDAYASVFSRIIARARPEWTPARLEEQYRRARQVRAVEGDPADVFVLSRVTLGADIAVTSIVLDGARRRFPTSNIWFVAPPKSWELFERSLRVCHLPVEYGRGGRLAGRLSIFEELRGAMDRPDAIVLDPDSRLSQLGLLPVCDPERHFLFESRSYGADGLEPLPALTRRWVAETLGVEDAEPWLHPRYEFDFAGQPTIAVSLGVGENPAKRVGGDFEVELLRLLAGTRTQVMVDAGAPGSEEEARVRAAVEACGEDAGAIGLHCGPFASFAALIAASGLYVGYDSAGQHVAAALGVPLISVFSGFVSPRMLARWTPEGPGPRTVLPVTADTTPAELLAAVRAALPAFAGDSAS
jgi:ADP-heptose:LPS heptosyltransferase